MRAESVILIVSSVLAVVRTLQGRDTYLNGTWNNIGFTVDFLQLVGMKAAQCVIFCESLYHSNVLKKYFTTLREVDDVLEKLQVKRSKSDRKRSLAILISMITFYVGTQLIVVSINVYREKHLMVVYWTDYVIAYFISCLRYFQMFHCVWFIRTRVEALNESLSTTNSEEKWKFNPIFDFERANQHRQAYHKLYMMSTMVNKYFGISSLINIANDFVTLTVNCYFVFLSLQGAAINFDNVLNVVQSFFWSLPHLVNVVLITLICQLTVDTVNSTADGSR